jgi:hypothetical protein
MHTAQPRQKLAQRQDNSMEISCTMQTMTMQQKSSAFSSLFFFEMGEISPQLLHPKDAHGFFY